MARAQISAMRTLIFTWSQSHSWKCCTRGHFRITASFARVYAIPALKTLPSYWACLKKSTPTTIRSPHSSTYRTRRDAPRLLEPLRIQLCGYVPHGPIAALGSPARLLALEAYVRRMLSGSEGNVNSLSLELRVSWTGRVAKSVRWVLSKLSTCVCTTVNRSHVRLAARCPSAITHMRTARSYASVLALAPRLQCAVPDARACYNSLALITRGGSMRASVLGCKFVRIGPFHRSHVYKTADVQYCTDCPGSVAVAGIPRNLRYKVIQAHVFVALSNSLHVRICVLKFAGITLPTSVLTMCRYLDSRGRGFMSTRWLYCMV